LFRWVSWLVRRTPLTSLLVALRTRTLSSRTQRHSFGLPAFRLANWFCVSRWFPTVREFAKNQMRSFRIGPPSETLLSQFLRSAGASAKPIARSGASMLVAWPHSPAKLPKYMPLNVLPPVFGMMLNVGAPRSDSPSPPEIDTCTSAELFMSYM
jgi:hypothetical protein